MIEDADDVGAEAGRRGGPMRNSRRRRGLIPFAVALFTLLFATAALAASGKLTQKDGTAGCISDDGSSGACADGSALGGASSVTVSPDGKSAYAASAADDAVAVFDRNPKTGKLTQKSGTAGCISSDGSGGACADGSALGGASSVTVSPDGKNAYVAATDSNAVAIFDRDPSTGALTQKPGKSGCVVPRLTNGDCADGEALRAPKSVTVSPDGKNAYVASFASDGVAVFDRNPTTGALTQKSGTDACITQTGNFGACAFGLRLDGASSISISPDGKSAYLAAYFSDAVAVFDRNPTTGALTQKASPDACVSETGSGDQCADGTALDGARSVTVSPDDESAYVASRFSDAVAVFDRNPTTGVLTQKTGTDACISQTGSGGVCADGVLLSAPADVTVSPDGKNVYGASFANDAVTVFDRNAKSGALTQKTIPDACVSQAGSSGQCGDGEALDGAQSVTVSPDGENAYVASSVSDGVAILDRNDGIIDGKASAAKTQKQKGKNIVVKVEVKVGEDLNAEATGKISIKKKSYKLKPVSKPVAPGEPTTLKLKPAKGKNSKKIAKGLKKSKGKAKIDVVLSDDAGNSSNSKLAVKLKRK